MNEQQAMEKARSDFDAEPDTEIVVDLADEGHSGPGWYAWLAEYPEDGSIFLGN